MAAYFYLAVTVLGLFWSQSSLQVSGAAALSGAGCPHGWSLNNVTCYHFSHDKEMWEVAREFCERFHGRLAEIDDAAEDKYLTAQVATNGESYWLNGNDLQVEGEWQWASQSSLFSAATYTNWQPGYPRADGSRNCIELSKGGYWVDNQCYEHQYYICERPATQSAPIVGK